MAKNKRHRRKAAPMLILTALLVIAGAAAILSPVLTIHKEIDLDAEEYKQLREYAALSGTEKAPINQDSEAHTPISAHTSEVVTGVSSPAVGKTGVDLAACKAENNDFIAWLQIPGTTVDYPVVQTDDVNYYLNHTFTGKKSYIGTLFSLGKTDFQKPSRNIAIYGHHIRSNAQVMFSPLTDYKEQSFYADHETIYLDTLYHAKAYRVFAVVNMTNGDWEPSIADFNSDTEFLRFVSRAKSLSLYDTGVDVQVSDHILTLITCDRTYGGKDGRLVIMAVEQPK